MIRRAIKTYEQPAPKRARRSTKSKAPKAKEPSLSLKITRAYMAGDYEKVIELAPAGSSISPEIADEVAWSWIILGDRLGDQAKQASGAEADRLFDQAGKRYTQALAIKPDKHEALNNWGAALAEQAKQKSGSEAQRLFEQAREKFAQALTIKPDMHEAINNWGNAFVGQASQKSGPEADRLFEQAGEKYAQALSIKPDMHEAFNNWSNALVGQARQKSGPEADRLFEQAGEKYAQALAIKLDKHEALNNWGIALISQAILHTDAKRDELLSLAEEKCHQLEALVPGKGAYNLACICSLRSQFSACQEWLEKSRSHGKLPSRKHLLNDTDLANVRGTDWFQKLIAELPE